jgi:hypothetical protein
VITPLDEPKYETVAEASTWLADREPVVLLAMNGEDRAYPLRILTWHEIVNDNVGDTPIALTFCPLCNTAVAYNRTVGERVLRFGTSGLLRNSDLVMWDRETESLWQQATGEAIVGVLTGTQLQFIPVSIVSWADFRQAYPAGKVLSQDTGFARAYGTNPYESYDSLTRPFLFDGKIDDRYPALERVVAVSVNGKEKAYPFEVISREKAVNDTVGGEPVVVLWGSADTASALSDSDITKGQAVGVGVAYSRTLDGRTLTFKPDGDGFRDEETGTAWNIVGQAVSGPLAGQRLKASISANYFWFAWAAFYSDGDVYVGSDRGQ